MALKALIISEDKRVADDIIEKTTRTDYEFIYSPTFLEGLAHLVSEKIALTVIQIEAPWETSINALYIIRWVSSTFLAAMLNSGNGDDKAHILDVADYCMWLPASHSDIAMVERRASKRRRSELTSHKKRAYYYNRGLLFFPQQFRVFYGDTELSPSRIMYDILHFLIRNRDMIVSREQILQEVWRDRYPNENEKTVTVHISAIRQMLDDVTKEKFIHTVRGFGYIFMTEKTLRSGIYDIDSQKKRAAS